MSSNLLLVAVPVVLATATVVAVPLGRWVGARAGHLLALPPLAAAVLLLVLLPRVLEAPIAVAVDWVPALGAQWHLRLDALSLVFALVATLVGAVVTTYSAHYLEDEEPGRYYGLLLAFATGMTVLVLAGDALVLYLGWELTTLTSYGLIATRPEGRRPAERALLLTFGGGLALLAALLLGVAERGTAVLAVLADPLGWSGGALVAFLALLVVAAAAKSAQVPFHVWLPGAMVAPTPVSAYLHAAAMVTAGLYLLLRFAEAIASRPVVGAAVVGLGTVTAVFAAAAAVRRSDVKELLAYSTIGQLGFMIALVGVGTAPAVAGALVYLVAHATYKGALFLAAGTYDRGWDAHTLPELAGSARRLPLTTAAAACACLSMAGIVPALGYVGKEEGLKGLFDAGAGTTLVVIGLGVALALTVAYTLRLAVAPFRRTPGTAAAGRPRLRRAHPMAVGPALLAAATVGIGVVAARLTPLVDAATHAALGETPTTPLGLWHGVTPAFLTSLATLALGAALFALWRARGWWRALAPNLGTRMVDGAVRGLRGAARHVAWWAAHPSPGVHLAVLLVGASLVVGSALLTPGAGTDDPWGDTGPRLVVALLLAGAAVGVARTNDRLMAVAGLAIVGFLVSAFYLLHGAPDLAVVQLLVDGLTVVLAIFVLRRLPRRSPPSELSRRRAAGLAAAVGGVAFAGLSLLQRGVTPSPASEHYVAEARASSAGNVVATIVTEFRALDTLGETAVVAVAALGVTAVLRIGRAAR